MFSVYTRVLAANLNLSPKSQNRTVWFFLLLNLIILFFLRQPLIKFYIYFEFSLIPIFIILLGWGYQPERLKARIYLLYYTIFFSLPLLIFILIQIKIFNIISWNLIFIINISSNYKLNLIFWIRSLAFFVKIPIYFLHLWLPKAHVESPTYGSIILAAILLKLGGFGVIRIFRLICTTKITEFVSSFSLFSAFFVRWICIREIDLKVIIAYSSVAHIAIALASLTRLTILSVTGSILIFLAHGICSSSLFLGVGFIFRLSASRRIILNKGILNNWSIFTLIWVFSLIGRIATPPTLNFIAEIVSLFPIAQNFLGNIRFIWLAFFRRGVYTLLLFRVSHSGWKIKKTFYLTSINFKIKLLFLLHNTYLLITILCLNIFI